MMVGQEIHLKKSGVLWPNRVQLYMTNLSLYNPFFNVKEIIRDKFSDYLKKYKVWTLVEDWLGSHQRVCYSFSPGTTIYFKGVKEILYYDHIKGDFLNPNTGQFELQELPRMTVVKDWEPVSSTGIKISSSSPFGHYQLILNDGKVIDIAVLPSKIRSLLHLLDNAVFEEDPVRARGYLQSAYPYLCE